MLSVDSIGEVSAAKAYMLIEGGSIFVAVLNVAIPILQISLAFVLHKPLRRKVGHSEVFACSAYMHLHQHQIYCCCLNVFVFAAWLVSYQIASLLVLLTSCTCALGSLSLSACTDICFLLAIVDLSLFGWWRF